MKNLVLFILFFLNLTVCDGQTFDEWFKQKKTQQKYLMQQIAALQIYKGYAQEGYSIAKRGLTTIGNIKKGDLNLHSDLLSSLKTVNPTIRNYHKVADIIAYEVKIIHTYNAACKQLQSATLLTTDEINYFYKVFTTLVTTSTGDINKLITVITAGKLEMKDDERIKRIDGIYGSIQDIYLFAKSLAGELTILDLARGNEKKNIETSRRLYGIKN